VATNESGTANFVDAIVIKKLTAGIIAAMPHLFGSRSNDYVSGKLNYAADVASGAASS
jgi:hypothetical protein